MGFRNDPTTQYNIIQVEHGRLAGAQRSLRNIKLDVQTSAAIRPQGRGDRRSCIPNLNVSANRRFKPRHPDEINVFHEAGLLKQVFIAP